MYIKPLVQIFQEFISAPAGITDPLRACLIGPNFHLVRYDRSDEKQVGRLGAYVPTADSWHAWPGRPAGATVDQSFTRVFIEDALLRYFSSAPVVGAEIQSTFYTSAHKNHIRSELISWRSNGPAYPRHVSLGQRDVAVGDHVLVIGPGAQHETYVAGFVADLTDPAIGAVAADENNADPIGSTAAVASQTGGDVNQVDIDVADPAAYNGLADGDLEETYVIRVVQGGAPASALLEVRSASGRDDADMVTPEDFGDPTPIGSRGLFVIFDLVGSSSGQPDDELFIAGQEWQVEVEQAFVVPTAAVASDPADYIGQSDTTYVVEVVRGGTLGTAEATQPIILVSTTTGVDASGPTHVPASATPVPIGTAGLTFQLTGTTVRKGDRYYIDAQAATDGPVRTLVLGRNLPDDLIGDEDAEPELTVLLSMRRNIEVPQLRPGFSGVANWQQSETQIRLNQGVQAYDSEWTNGGGTMLALNVVGGTAYVQYRAYLPTYGRRVGVLTSASEVAAALGPPDADNPLACGVLKALGAANGSPVLFVATESDSLSAWSRALDLLTIRNDAYSLVPLTFDRQVQELVAGHCRSLSAPEVGRWRRAIVSTAVPAELAVLSDLNGAAVLATVQDDPMAEGEQYTFVEFGAGVDLSASGVRAGDILRTAYRPDGIGGTIYDEYVVDAVLSDDSLRLLSGPSVPTAVPSKVEIWRAQQSDEIVQAVRSASGSFGSRRVVNVFPDEIEDGGESVAGYYLAASIAGQTSGVVPQQGLTNVQVVGFSAVSRLTGELTEADLDRMAEAGTWLVVQLDDGQIVTRHALTTDMTDLNTREEMITRNVDSISYTLLGVMRRYSGRYNVVEQTLAQVEADTQAVINELAATTGTGTLGPQLVDGTITRLEQSSLFKDRVVAAIDLDLPYPMNNLQIHLVAQA